MPTLKEMREPKQILEDFADDVISNWERGCKNDLPTLIVQTLFKLSSYYKSQEVKRLGVEEIAKILMEQMPIREWESLSEHKKRLAQAICKAQEEG